MVIYVEGNGPSTLYPQGRVLAMVRCANEELATFKSAQLAIYTSASGMPDMYRLPSARCKKRPTTIGRDKFYGVVQDGRL